MVLGGVLTAELSWRHVLFVNVPIGAALLAGAVAALVPAHCNRQRTRLDFPGALTITLGTGLLVYGVSGATADGRGSAVVIASLAVAWALLASFVLRTPGLSASAAATSGVDDSGTSGRAPQANVAQH